MYSIVLGTSLQEDALGSKSRKGECTEEVVEESGVDVHEFLGIGPGA